MTILAALELQRRLPHTPPMQRNPMAGGFILLVAILAGFAIGVATGDAVRGAMLGTVAGIVLAIAVWLVDRRR